MFKSDIEIAQESVMENISNIAEKIALKKEHLELYGNYKAKISLDVMDEMKDKKDGNLILVTAINPTRAGEGKSTTTVGLVDGLSKLDKKVIGCLREPSLGPVFGIKGGAAGGGYAQVVPMEDINLHFTGDMNAITIANNLISATIDNHIHQGNELKIDLENILWKRCMDMNDRSLRQIEVGLGKKSNGVERLDGFNITVASEIMAILCLATSLDDFRNRVAKIIVAYSEEGMPISVADLKIVGAITMIMKDAIKPNLVQTLEKTPVLMHGGPFANIAHGCNSLIATKMALKLGDYVVTEAGFGADLGSEKFIDIKTRIGDLKPSCIVIVATIRALKLHGGCEIDNLIDENVEAVKKGIENLAKHIETVSHYNLPYVVAINKFISDTEAEEETLFSWCQENNHPVVLSDVWEHGGAGGIELASEVIKACDENKQHQYIYELDDSFEDKITKVVQKCYGGKSFIMTEKAQTDFANIKKIGLDKLPICMAKTPASLSDDAKLVGRPVDFEITIKEIRISAGAGFLVVLTGNVMTMPGLPKTPAAEKMDVVDGKIVGLF